MSEERCLWHWKDSAQTVLECTVHDNERQVVRPQDKDEVVRLIKEAGEWLDADPLAPSPGVPAPPPPAVTTPALVPTVSQQSGEVVEYDSIAGTKVTLTVEGFQTLLCRQANRQQAQFMIAWCRHNRIDPFSNEGHFSVIDGQPVIQVSKDAWFKRMEAHPDFAGHDSGILVRAQRATLTTAAAIDNDDYVMTEAMKKALLAPKAALPDKLTVKKRGQFVDDGEELVGGWCTILKKSRPAPILFQIPLKGWEQSKRSGEVNVFWERKQSFMIWKSALKNGARLAFPDLSGLLGVPEFDDEGTDDARPLREVPRAEGLTTEEQRKALLQTLHAAGADVPPPHGPLNHLDLHHIAAALYNVDSLAMLTVAQLSDFCGHVTVAQTDAADAAELARHIPIRERGTLKLKKQRTSDEMGVT